MKKVLLLLTVPESKIKEVGGGLRIQNESVHAASSCAVFVKKIDLDSSIQLCSGISLHL